jgi:hypothetical protein
MTIYNFYKSRTKGIVHLFGRHWNDRTGEMGMVGTSVAGNGYPSEAPENLYFCCKQKQ